MKIKCFIVTGVVSSLLSCSIESNQPTKTANENLTASPDFQDNSNNRSATIPVKVYGDFTNVRSNGEHQWGYTVEIWRQGSSIFGLMSGSSSPRTVGDPPTGILEDQIFDETSGKFSFKTLTASNRYHFEGILTKNELKGRLLDTNTNATEKIVLKRDKETSLMDEFASLEDWKKYTDRILKFRGPK